MAIIIMVRCLWVITRNVAGVEKSSTNVYEKTKH